MGTSVRRYSIKLGLFPEQLLPVAFPVQGFTAEQGDWWGDVTVEV